MAPRSAAVAAEGLSVRRGGTQVLHELDLDIEAGRVTGLLGPSGCGKSTLMRAIVGVQSGVTGRLDVLGSPAGSASLRSRIGYVTQAASVYDDLSVTENLRFFARILEVGADRVTEAIGAVDLASYPSALVGNLSGGQRSRVSLAVALLGEPDLLVLDEPTVGLDPALRVELWATFHRLADAGAAVLVSTHVMDEAERCDDLVLLREGRILATGGPDQVKQRTGTDSVEAAFLALVARERQ